MLQFIHINSQTPPHKIFETIQQNQFYQTKKIQLPIQKMDSSAQSFYNTKITVSKKARPSPQICNLRIKRLDKNANLALRGLSKSLRTQLNISGPIQFAKSTENRKILTQSEQKQKAEPFAMLLNRKRMKTTLTLRSQRDEININQNKDIVVGTSNKGQSTRICRQKKSNYKLLSLVGKCCTLSNNILNEEMLVGELEHSPSKGPNA